MTREYIVINMCDRCSLRNLLRCKTLGDRIGDDHVCVCTVIGSQIAHTRNGRHLPECEVHKNKLFVSLAHKLTVL